MKSEIKGGMILLQLEDDDFKERDWQAFLKALKLNIPSDQREYRADLKTWIIENTKENLQRIEILQTAYFVDKEQLRML
jgi:hypothetical protein